MVIRLDQLDSTESARRLNYFERRYNRQVRTAVNQACEQRASTSARDTSFPSTSIPAQPRPRPSYISQDIVISSSDEEEEEQNEEQENTEMDLGLDDEVMCPNQ